MEATSSSIHKYALIAKSNLFRSTTCIGARKLRYTEPFQINNKPNILSINFDWAPLEMLPSFFGEMEKPIHTFFALFMSVYRSFHKATHKLNARKMRCGLEKNSYSKSVFPATFSPFGILSCDTNASKSIGTKRWRRKQKLKFDHFLCSARRQRENIHNEKKN